MAYFPDLSSYEYEDVPSGRSTVNVGWLDRSHPYPKGDVPATFTSKLWTLSTFAVDPSRGVHECEFCSNAPVGLLTVQRDAETLRLGSAEIRVFGNGERVYAAPNLLYHYVVAHQYRPPDEFIEAVLTGPLPPDEAYINRLRKLDLAWKDLKAGGR
jgi:hypothetical protein